MHMGHENFGHLTHLELASRVHKLVLSAFAGVDDPPSAGVKHEESECGHAKEKMTYTARSILIARLETFLVGQGRPAAVPRNVKLILSGIVVN